MAVGLRDEAVIRELGSYDGRQRGLGGVAGDRVRAADDSDALVDQLRPKGEKVGWRFRRPAQLLKRGLRGRRVAFFSACRTVWPLENGPDMSLECQRVEFPDSAGR